MQECERVFENSRSRGRVPFQKVKRIFHLGAGMKWAGIYILSFLIFKRKAPSLPRASRGEGRELYTLLSQQSRDEIFTRKPRNSPPSLREGGTAIIGNGILFGNMLIEI